MDCILPAGWTVDTLMEAHNSNPYNPDIANVFYRAGYIEHWGRGIQKICDACEELGANPPVYQLLGNNIRVHFKALQSAIIDNSKAPKRQNVDLDVDLDVGLDDRIMKIILVNDTITMANIAEQLNVNKKTVEREIKKLREMGRIERIGGKRYGHWHIKALQTSIIDDSKTPKRQNVGLDVGLDDRIIKIVLANDTITMVNIAEKLNVNKKAVEREMKKLREMGRIERIGGKRYGYWHIN